jgi:hypothetical protein
LFCAVLAATCLGASPAHAIVGGTPTTGDPAVVALARDLVGAYCSGSIVAPTLVLTAAHCVKYFEPDTVVLGTSEESGKRIRVLRTAMHPKYTSGAPESANFDVAVVVLSADAGVKPLATNHVALDNAFVGRDVRHVGFGTTSEHGLDIDTKRTLTHAVTKLDAAKIYTGSAKAGVCNGDSGGPALAMVGDASEERIVSIVSDGPGCQEGTFDIRLDAPEVAAWLDVLIASHGGAPAPNAGVPAQGAPADGAKTTNDAGVSVETAGGAAPSTPGAAAPGCTLGAARQRSSLPLVLALCGLALWRGRRSRSSIAISDRRR